jgi:DNA-binding CsgD family transcriptional regulator
MPTSSRPFRPRNASVSNEFMVFLTQHPDLNEICNHIIFTWPGSDVMQQATIGQIRTDGTIEFSGCFGFTAHDGSVFGASTIWDDTPASAAVRDHRLVLLADRANIQEQFANYAKKMPDLNSVMAAPLMSHSTPFGVCVISSDEPMAQPQQSAEILNDYSLALSLYVQPTPANDSQPVQPPSRQPSEVPPRSTLVSHQLTERQLIVLRYLCQGYSNRQIAQRMGFSESTVRQDTMAIYASLGVHRRAEAIRTALERGMVADPTGENDQDVRSINE